MGEDDKLDLSNHELEYFQSRLPRLNLLIHLDLSYNKIVNLEHSAFAACVQLEQLNLRGNRIEQVRGLESLGALIQLDLAENLIERYACMVLLL